MKFDITKRCANSLRTHLSAKYGIQLKSSHAHEIVAAFWGYKSKIALLADAQHSLDNLPAAEFILLESSANFVDQRLKSLNELPAGLPPSDLLVEGIYSAIMEDEVLSRKIQQSFRDLVVSLAKQHISEQTRPFGVEPEFTTEVDVKPAVTDGEFTVWFNSPSSEGKYSSYAKVDVRFPRVAGRIGYAEPEIVPTFYTGEARNPDFRLKHAIT